MTPLEQKQRSEIGRLEHKLHQSSEDRKAMAQDFMVLREAMGEIRGLLHSGQIREALAVIDNEQRIYENRRQPRKGKVA
jgi:hypothetical protein